MEGADHGCWSIPTSLWARLREPERWLAASVPGWTNMEHTVARYQPRYLSDSGRVFFDSSDVLVPQATNGLMDVYEYEPEGTGSCEGTSGTFSESCGWLCGVGFVGFVG